jgi:TonB family protein
MPDDDDIAEFAIDATPIWSPDDSRLEPVFMAGPLWVDFEDAAQRDPPLPAWPADAPQLFEFEDSPALDRERGWIAPPRRQAAVSLLGSLGLHLLAFLALLDWNVAAADSGAPIPVQLVVERPAAPPPARQHEDLPVVEPSASEAKVAPAPPPSPPQPTRLAATPPKPNRAPPQPQPKREPARVAAAVQPPQPERAVQRPGPGFSRSDYFARLVALTRPHLDLLPLAFLAGRRGKTTLAILVMPDGAVANISIKESSGYSDIDARVAQIVAAVGRFPPLPPAYQGRNLELDFDLRFPDAMVGR